MADQLSAKDWLDQGLKTLARSGFTALKAEPLAKAMGVSRGSFYWHFADIGAFHAAILKHWREVAAEQIIAGPRGLAGRRESAAAAAAPGVRRQAGAGECGSHLGDGRSRGARRRAGDRPAPAGLCRKPVSRHAGLAPEYGARPRANPVLGVSRLCAVGQAVAAGETGSRARRNCCGSPRDRTAAARLATNMLQDRKTKPEQRMNPRPNASKPPSIRSCWKFWSAR